MLNFIRILLLLLISLNTWWILEIELNTAQHKKTSLGIIILGDDNGAIRKCVEKITSNLGITGKFTTAVFRGKESLEYIVNNKEQDESLQSKGDYILLIETIKDDQGDYTIKYALTHFQFPLVKIILI